MCLTSKYKVLKIVPTRDYNRKLFGHIDTKSFNPYEISQIYTII